MRRPSPLSCCSLMKARALRPGCRCRWRGWLWASAGCGSSTSSISWTASMDWLAAKPSRSRSATSCCPIAAGPGTARTCPHHCRRRRRLSRVELASSESLHGGRRVDPAGLPARLADARSGLAGYWPAAVILPLYFAVDATITLVAAAARREALAAASGAFLPARRAGGRTPPAVVAHVSIANACLMMLALLSVVHPLPALAGAAAVVTTLLLHLRQTAHRNHQKTVQK